MTCLRPRVCTVLFACLLCVVPFAARLAAQAGTGTLTGSIVDAQGGALPGATITVTEQATTAARTIVSDRDGVFRIPALPPGRYNLDITMEGFSPLKVTDVSLAPAEVRASTRSSSRSANSPNLSSSRRPRLSRRRPVRVWAP